MFRAEDLIESKLLSNLFQHCVVNSLQWSQILTKMALAVQSFVLTGWWWTMEGSRRSLEWGEEAKFRKVHSHRSRAGPAGIGWPDIKVSATIYYYNLGIKLKLLSRVTYNKYNSSAFVDPIIARSTVINKQQGQQYNAKKLTWNGGRLGVNQNGTRKRNNLWKGPKHICQRGCH